MKKIFRIAALMTLLIDISPPSNEPFELSTVATPTGKLTMLWEWLEPAIRKDQATIAACQTDPACGSVAALRLAAIVTEAMQYTGRARVGHINRAVNEVIPKSLGLVTWMSPLAAMNLSGDCKSYAVVKYAALANAGIAAADRRLIMIWDHTHPKENHLVVVVRVDLRWLILDDETLILIDSTDKSIYQPLHSFDETGVRDFAPVTGAASS